MYQFSNLDKCFCESDAKRISTCLYLPNYFILPEKKSKQGKTYLHGGRFGWIDHDSTIEYIKLNKHQT